MDAINLLQYFFALMFVAALGGAALLFRRYSNNPQAFRQGLSGKLGRWDFKASERRLAVVETLVIGPKQRLLIVRRDNVEHLVMAGPEGCAVIEGNIAAKGPLP